MKARTILAAVAAAVLSLTTLGIQPASAAGSPTLRSLARPAGILMGSGAINPTYLDDPQFAHVLATEFQSLSPENELKWMFVHPAKNVYNFEGLDRLVAFAHANHMVVKGHGLISGCCNPQYLVDITDPVTFRQAMVDHFTTVMRRYKGKMDRWDVATEVFETLGSQLQSNDFSRVLGNGYIAEAFRIAHAADPDATLFLNENLVEFLPEKRQALYDLVSGLVADGVPIDGVALQMHETLAGPQPGVITEIVKSYHALGLKVSVAELDVHTYDPIQQADIYGAVLAEALAAGVTDISTWGFTDKHLYTWLPGAKPLLFDENFNAKPAYNAYRSALESFTHDRVAPSVAKLSATTERSLNGSYTVALELKKNATPGSYFYLYENGVLVHAQAINTVSGTPQKIEVSFVNKPNGVYVYRARLVNSHGSTASQKTTVKVKLNQ